MGYSLKSTVTITFIVTLLFSDGLPMELSRGLFNGAHERQETHRRGRRIVTTSSSHIVTNILDLTSRWEDVAQTAAFHSSEKHPWPTKLPFLKNSSTLPDSRSPSPSTVHSFQKKSTRALFEVVAKPHAKVILPCDLETNQSKIVFPATRNYRLRPATWLHEGSPVDMITIDTRTELSGTGHRYVGDSTTFALNIEKVRLEDDGVWDCTFESHDKKTITGRPVRLVVLEAPRGTYLLIDGRRLDPGNQFVPVKEGSELTLECEAEGGNPPATLVWSMTLSQDILDGPEQPPNNLTILQETLKKRSNAHLKVSRGHHNATIICIAQHVTLFTPLNASILLDVQYTPSFAITRLPGFGTPIVEGMSVSLKCDVDSNPLSLPIWQRDNGPPPVEQRDDGWLNFTKISRSDSGWYKCYTRHILGIFTSIGYFLNVRYKASYEIDAQEAWDTDSSDSKKIEVRIGGAVTLQCKGGCWGHGPEMDPVSQSGLLNITHVVYQDSGDYRCVTPGKRLQDKWRTQLYHIRVFGLPMVFPKMQTITTNQGSRLDVIVEFCSEPAYTKVLWLSEKLVYLPGTESHKGVQAMPIQNSETSYCYIATLRFESIQRSHSGEWLLLVSSSEGIAEATVTLNVTQEAITSRAFGRTSSTLILSICFIVAINRHYY